ncbi:MAG: HAD-IB family phosphatase [Gammaproteobacteria bacterium]|nr:HAD-IB family phosphatase [Gammaproteobacteria bacterium]MDE0414915.1 HAD-IB family phosphatase [Gammaproteobacteria bacterium]
MNGPKSVPGLALFDIDGTLLNEPSSEKRFMLWLFLRWRIGPVRLLAYALFALRYFPRYGPGVFAKNKSLLWRRTVGGTESLAREWAAERLDRAFHGPCLERLRAHQQGGDIVVLLSGTPSVLADAIAERLGVDNVVATECALAAGRYGFGPPIVHCVGEAKLASARDLCARFETTLADTTAYGNSLSDLPLLGACGLPVAVNPDSALAAIAREKGWEVIGSPARGRVRASA